MKSRNVAKVEVTGGSWTFNLDLLRLVTRGGQLAILECKLKGTKTLVVY